MKRLICVCVLTLALMAALLIFASASADEPRDWLGKPMPDFTADTVGGERFTLSEALKTKKAVLVNFWATWCGPCINEFPYMEQAYQLYKDEVAIIALSTEVDDTDDEIREFAEEMELTFLMASDTQTGLGAIFAPNGIPTSVLIDRYGNIVLVELGAQFRLDAFTNAFDLLISDTYTETTTLNGFPGTKPALNAVDDGELSRALGEPPFTVRSSDNPFAWPFLPAINEGVECVSASNVGEVPTYSEVIAEIDAHAGDVFAFDAEINTEDFYEKLVLSLNGEKIRTFSGRMPRFTYAIELSEGRNVVSLRYDKSIEYVVDVPNENEQVLLYSFRLLGGEEGTKALSADPVFTYSDETALAVTNASAREVRITDQDGGDVLFDLYGSNTRGFIVNDIVARCAAAISREYDPDEIFITENSTDMLYTAYTFQNKTLIVPLNNWTDTGLTSTLVLMYNTLDSRIANLILFDTEQSATQFCERLLSRDITADWAYVEGGA